MSRFERGARVLLDLSHNAVRHPAGVGRMMFQRLLQVRGYSNACFKYGLPQVCHEHLDPRLSRLSVEIGGASPIDYSKTALVDAVTAVDFMKSLIVSRIAKMLDVQRVLEIGTYRGCMTFHIARNSPDSCRIWTLDIPQSAVSSLANGMLASDAVMADMGDELVGCEWKDTPESAKITQLWGDSLHYDFTSLGPFDLIYIDGSHAEKWVEKDTESAFSNLAESGAILWDDCYWSDVQRVLARFSAEHPIYLFEDGQTAGYLRLDGTAVRI